MLSKSLVSDMEMNKNNPFRLIISSQYFLYFGVMGIFLPYFNLYCYHLGFSGFQIGVLSALRSVVMVLFSLLWGRLADRFQARKPIYVFCNFISAGVWTFFLFTEDFSFMVLITIAYTIFYAPVISFMEAFTMDILGREKRSYGKVRVWGTLAFITIVTLFGRLIDLYSVNIILIPVLAGSLMQAFSGIKLPAVRNSRSFSPMVASQFPVPAFYVFLFCAFLMLLSHGTYYGFFSIHLEKLGYGNTFIGTAWALASASEILVMIFSERIFRRFSIEKVLVFSFIIAALRWFVLCFAETAAAILISQISHAVTYGTFHIASILYIDRISPDEAKTTGQAVNNAVTYGLGMMAGFFMNGYFYEHLSLFVLFAASSVSALIGGVILALSYRLSANQL
jgi:PPP family 3-phenylpropionic acid transporter